MSGEKEKNLSEPVATDKGLLRLLGILSLVVGGLWFLAFIIIVAIGAYDGSGTFGDSFGVINALFTGLAFAAVVAALIVQQKDLQASLSELRVSTAALKEQAKASTELMPKLSLRVSNVVQQFTSDSTHSR